MNIELQMRANGQWEDEVKVEEDEVEAREKLDSGWEEMEGWQRGWKNGASKKGEVVVLRSVRMSASPHLSGEAAHRLYLSVTVLVYASLWGRGKGRRVVGVCTVGFGGLVWKWGNFENKCSALFITKWVTLPFIMLLFFPRIQLFSFQIIFSLLLVLRLFVERLFSWLCSVLSQWALKFDWNNYFHIL